MKKTLFCCTAAVSSLLGLSSCATIVTGNSAKITIDGDVKEPVTVVTSYQSYPNLELPAVVRVSRKKMDGQHIQIKSEHYDFKDIVLAKSINPWTFGNILIGGIIGWGVDLATNCVVTPAVSYFQVEPQEKKQEEAAPKE